MAGFSPPLSQALSAKVQPCSAILLPATSKRSFIPTPIWHPSGKRGRSLEIYARDRVGEAVARKSPHFLAHLSALSQHPLVGEARGLGLVGALELVADKASKRQFEPRAGIGPRVIQFAEEEGLMVRSLAGDVVSLYPPLIISVAEVDLLFDRLGRSLDRTLGWAKQERLIP
jgi:4-aminobutyrate--pyruvate transaminase